MTAYTALGSFANGGTNQFFGIKPVTYPVRIARIDMAANGAVQFVFYHYKTSNLTGGTTVTPLPLRGGAPASTVTCKTLMTTSNFTGTGTIIVTQIVGSYHQTTDSLGAITTTPDPGSSNYSFPFDYIVAVGDSFVCQVVTNATTPTSGGASVYFEELRLSWSF